MTVNAGKRKYPYSRNRVYLSALIAMLSMVLAMIPFQSASTPVLFYIIYFLLSTLAVTVATFLLKMRLYPLITESPSTIEQPRRQTETSWSKWKMLLVAFFMLITPILVPLLLAGVLGGLGWFILIVSFTLGVNISEIIFYFHTQ